MTTATMQAVATAITGAGYNATITKVADNSWIVNATALNPDINIADAFNLATAQSVTAKASSVQFF